MPPTAKFDDKAIAEYCKVNTWQDAAIVFGCSRATVTAACAKHSVIPKNKCAIERAAIAEWVKERNASVSDAVKKFNSSRQRVLAACRENNVTPCAEDSQQVASRSTFEVLALLIQGYTSTQIAAEFHVSHQRINQIRKNAEYAELIGDNSIVVLRDN